MQRLATGGWGLDGMRDDRRDPVNRDEILARRQVDPQQAEQGWATGRSDRHPGEKGVAETEGGEQPVIGGGVSRVGIANDDRRPVDGDCSGARCCADKLLRLDLAPLVVVAVLLAAFEVILGDPARSQPADVGGGDMVEVFDVGGLDEIEDVANTADIRQPGLGGTVGAAEVQTGRVVEDRAAVFADPGQVVSAQPAQGTGHVAVKHTRSREPFAEFVLPVDELGIDPLGR